MNKERVQKLYDAVSKEYDVQDFDTFTNDIQDVNKLLKVYGIVSQKYSVPNFDTFRNDLGLTKKKNSQSNANPYLESSVSELQEQNTQSPIGGNNPTPEPTIPPLKKVLANKEQDQSILPLSDINSEMQVSDVNNILKVNRDKNFVNRIINNNNGYEPIKNDDGSISTHLMSYGEADGKYYVYPEIVDKGDGKLVKLDRDKAFDYAMKSGEFIEFNDEKSASDFSEKYKNGIGMGKPLTPLQQYAPQIMKYQSLLAANVTPINAAAIVKKDMVGNDPAISFLDKYIFGNNNNNNNNNVDLSGSELYINQFHNEEGYDVVIPKKEMTSKDRDDIFTDYRELSKTNTPDDVVSKLTEKYGDFGVLLPFQISSAEINLVQNKILLNDDVSPNAIYTSDYYVNNIRKSYIDKGYSASSVDAAIENVKKQKWGDYISELKDKQIDKYYNLFNGEYSKDEIKSKAMDKVIADGFMMFTDDQRELAKLNMEMQTLQEKEDKNTNDYVRMSIINRRIISLNESGYDNVYDWVTGERTDDPEVVKQHNEGVDHYVQKYSGTTRDMLQQEMLYTWLELQDAQEKYNIHKKSADIYYRNSDGDMKSDNDDIAFRVTDLSHKFEAISRLALLNDSPSNVKKGLGFYFNTFGNAIDEGMNDWLGTTSLIPSSTERDYLDKSKEIYNNVGITPTEDEANKMKVLFGETLLDMGGHAVPMVLQFMIGNKILSAYGFTQAVEKISSYNKFLGFIAKISEDELLFRSIGGKPGAGAGFGAANIVVPKIFRGATRTGLAEITNRMFQSSIGVTFGGEVGNITSSAYEAITSDKDFSEAMSEKYPNETKRERDLLSSLIINAAFGVSPSAFREQRNNRKLIKGGENLVLMDKRGYDVEQMIVQDGELSGKETPSSRVESASKAVEKLSNTASKQKDKQQLLTTSKELHDLSKKLKKQGELQTSRVVENYAKSTEIVENDKSIEVEYITDVPEVKEKLEVKKIGSKTPTEIALSIANDIEQSTGVRPELSEIEKSISDNLKGLLPKKIDVPESIRNLKWGNDKGVLNSSFGVKELWNTLVEGTALLWQGGEALNKAAKKMFNKYSKSEVLQSLSKEDRKTFENDFIEKIVGEFTKKHGSEYNEVKDVNTFLSNNIKRSTITITALNKAKNELKLARERQKTEVIKGKLNDVNNKNEAEKLKAKTLKTAKENTKQYVEVFRDEFGNMSGGRIVGLLNKFNKAKTPEQVEAAIDKMYEYSKDVNYRYEYNKAVDNKKVAKKEKWKYPKKYKGRVDALLSIDISVMNHDILHDYNNLLDKMKKKGIKDLSAINEFYDKFQAEVDIAVEKSLIGTVDGSIYTPDGFKQAVEKMDEKVKSLVELGASADRKDIISAKMSIGRIRNAINNMRKSGKLINADKVTKEGGLIDIDDGWINPKYIEFIENELTPMSDIIDQAELTFKQENVSDLQQLTKGFINRVDSDGYFLLDNGNEIKPNDFEILTIYDFVSSINGLDLMSKTGKESTWNYVNTSDIINARSVFENLNNGYISPEIYRVTENLRSSFRAAELNNNVIPEVTKKYYKYLDVKNVLNSISKVTKNFRKKPAMSAGNIFRLTDDIYDKFGSMLSGAVELGVINSRKLSGTIRNEVTYVDSKTGVAEKINIEKVLKRGSDIDKMTSFAIMLQANHQFNIKYSKVYEDPNAKGKFAVITPNEIILKGGFDTAKEATSEMNDLISEYIQNTAPNKLDFFEQLNSNDLLKSIKKGMTPFQEKAYKNKLFKAYGRAKELMGTGDYLVFKNENDFKDKIEKIKGTKVGGVYNSMRKFFDSQEINNVAEIVAQMEGVDFVKLNYYVPRSVINGINKSDVDLIMDVFGNKPSTQFGNIKERNGKLSAVDYDAVKVIDKYVNDLGISYGLRQSLKVFNGTLQKLTMNNDRVVRVYKKEVEDIILDIKNKTDKLKELNYDNKQIDEIINADYSEVKNRNKLRDNLLYTISNGEYVPYMRTLVGGLRNDMDLRVRRELSGGKLFEGTNGLTIVLGSIGRTIVSAQMIKYLSSVVRIFTQEMLANNIKIIMGGAGGGFENSVKDITATYNRGKTYNDFLKREGVYLGSSMKKNDIQNKFSAAKEFGNKSFMNIINNKFVSSIDMLIGGGKIKSAFERKFESLTGEKINYNKAFNDLKYTSKHYDALMESQSFANGEYSRLAPSTTKFGRRSGFGEKKSGIAIGTTSDYMVMSSFLQGYTYNESNEFIGAVKDVFRGHNVSESLVQIAGLIGSNMAYAISGRLLKPLFDQGVTNLYMFLSDDYGKKDLEKYFKQKAIDATDPKSVFTACIGTIATLSFGLGANVSRLLLSATASLGIDAYLKQNNMSSSETKKAKKEIGDILSNVGIYSFMSPVDLGFGNVKRSISQILDLGFPILSNGVKDIVVSIEDINAIIQGRKNPTADELYYLRVLSVVNNLTTLIGMSIPGTADVYRYVNSARSSYNKKKNDKNKESKKDKKEEEVKNTSTFDGVGVWN